MEKLNALVEQAKFVADWHGSDWSSALCQGKDGKQTHEIICESRGEAVISTGSNSNEASWLCDYLELCSPANILDIAEAFRALQKQRDALAAENAILKNGIGFFSYGTDSGFEEHDSAEKAIAAADSDIDYYRGDACDGWSEETDQTVWGVILQRATMIDERPRTEEDSYLGSHIASICDYALLPNMATPATDAYLNSVRAEGVDDLATFAGEQYQQHVGDKAQQKKWKSIVFLCTQFATQLRAGKDGE
ncbi:hypothetical protein [Pantoea agglomerans]|uniref:hypothetical protein n=1 Tax=Enterobacter agglomerans TaxID=549 RepID=UPI0002554132|nr:hypothetical protein [Pantoea agglomerans]